MCFARRCGRVYQLFKSQAFDIFLLRGHRRCIAFPLCNRRTAGCLQGGEGMGRRDSRTVYVRGSVCSAEVGGGSTACQKLASSAAHSTQVRAEHEPQVPQTADVFQPT